LKPLEPLALNHSWPLFERGRRFDLGHLLNCAVTETLTPVGVGQLGMHHSGCWECDLAGNQLTWSGGVYDIFGLPRGVPVTREEAVALYCEESRSALERLRSYALKHKRGFTIDVEIRPATGEARRWMRLIGATECEDGRPVRLHGVKLIV
jgi:PAS domain-containing protein